MGEQTMSNYPTGQLSCMLWNALCTSFESPHQTLWRCGFVKLHCHWYQEWMPQHVGSKKYLRRFTVDAGSSNPKNYHSMGKSTDFFNSFLTGGWGEMAGLSLLKALFTKDFQLGRLQFSVTPNICHKNTVQAILIAFCCRDLLKIL